MRGPVAPNTTDLREHVSSIPRAVWVSKTLGDLPDKQHIEKHTRQLTVVEQVRSFSGRAVTRPKKDILEWEPHQNRH